MAVDSQTRAVVEGLVAAWSSFDPEGVLRHCAADVELTPYFAAIDAATYHGPEGVRQAVEAQREAFEEIELRVVELDQVGELLLARIHGRGRGRGGGVEVSVDYYVLGLVDGAEVRWWRSHPSRQSALAQAAEIGDGG